MAQEKLSHGSLTVQELLFQAHTYLPDGITGSSPASEKLVFAAVTTVACLHQTASIVFLLLLSIVEIVSQLLPQSLPRPDASPASPPFSICPSTLSLLSSWILRHKCHNTVQGHNRSRKVRLLGPFLTFFGDFLVCSSKLDSLWSLFHSTSGSSPSNGSQPSQC